MHFAKGKPAEPRYATYPGSHAKEERWLWAEHDSSPVRAEARLVEFVTPRSSLVRNDSAICLQSPQQPKLLHESRVTTTMRL
jgi:hypothetical protein